jgi:hypothetical protein
MKKILSLLLAIILLSFSLCACKEKTTIDPNSITSIKFSQPIEDLRDLSKCKVEIKGFMSLLSPLDGKLIYLMNLPFQNCPFCLPNSTTLDNTIAVTSSNIEFTTNPVKVVGTLKFGDFTDEYGYEYSYRIENAEITVLDEKEISEQMKIYYTLSQEDYISEVYTVMSYLDEVANHEFYEIEPEYFDELGPIPFDNFQTIQNAINNLNTDHSYDDFIELLTLTEETRTKINVSLNNKEYDKYSSYQSDVETLFKMFNDFINKYTL